MGPLHREASERITDRVGQRQAAPSSSGRATEHRIDQSRSAPAGALRETDARVDRGVCGHALEEHELVESEPQRRPHGGLEPRERRAEERAEMMIEAALPGERSVDEPGREPAVGRAEWRRCEAVREEFVREGLGRLHADQDLLRDPSRIAPGFYSPRHVPGGNRWPARKRSALSRRRPSSWTSSNRRPPAPVVTRIPSGPARMI